MPKTSKFLSNWINSKKHTILERQELEIMHCLHRMELGQQVVSKLNMTCIKIVVEMSLCLHNNKNHRELCNKEQTSEYKIF